MVCLGLHRCSQYSGGLVDLVDKTICFIDKIFINKISRTDNSTFPDNRVNYLHLSGNRHESHHVRWVPQ